MAERSDDDAPPGGRGALASRLSVPDPRSARVHYQHDPHPPALPPGPAPPQPDRLRLREDAAPRLRPAAGRAPHLRRRRLDHPIAFRLDPRIADAFVAKSVTGIKDGEVTEYRRALLAGAVSAFPRVQVVEAISAEGFGVTLVEARPQAVKVSAIARGSGTTTYTEHEVRCEVTYGFSIHEGGGVTNVTGQVTSMSTANLAAQMDPVCAEGLQAMFAEMRMRVAGELGASR